MPSKNPFVGNDLRMGLEESLFNKVLWKEDRDYDRPGPFKPLNNPRVKLFDFEIDEWSSTDKGNNFFNTLNFSTGKLSELYKASHSSSNSYPDSSKPYWDGVVHLEDNNYLRIEDLVLKAPMEDDPSMIHSHKVLQSLSFQDVGITIRFDQNDGSYYDTFVPLPLFPANYQSFVGIEGTYKESKRYQMGLNQVFYFYMKIGDKYLGLKVEFSLVLCYPRNDFEPLGVIDAGLFYPQIKFYSGTFDISDTDVFPPTGSILLPEMNSLYTPISAPVTVATAISTTSDLPAGVIESSFRIHRYQGRVKMVANNDNSDHVNLQTVNGVTYDFNHFKKVREDGKMSLIPDMFEKVFDSDAPPLNVPGLYTDSNGSGFETDKRLYPAYYLTSIYPPTWAYIFDYKKANLQYQTEIKAVYGFQDNNFSSTPQGKFAPLRTRKYKYPLLNTGNHAIGLTKYARQGEYDNIHFHGYLGNYKDNSSIVLHAPICGFCCFHLHWRWSPLNYDLNSNRLFQLLTASGNASRFLGWKVDGTGKNTDPGGPLIPPNQSLRIAITNPDIQPYDGENVLDPNAAPSLLSTNVKAVWYSFDIINVPVLSPSFVVMEQGAGYAFQYSKSVNRLIGFGEFMVKRIVNLLPLAIRQFIDDVIDDLDTQDYFEIIYRLMRFFNFDANFSTFDQIPDGIYSPNSDNISMESL